MEDAKIISLRMERQCLDHPADEAAYIELFRDTQPGKNTYWNGFGQPPTLSFRAGFDDLEFNRQRQLDRRLVKGRFAGGNLGWIMREDAELFAALYRKPLVKPAEAHLRILEMIRREGPLNIQQMKEETGMLVKELTPVLHRLQEAFLVYEDQYDGEWDRGWYPFEEMFPHADLERFSRQEALKTVLRRFAYRMVWFDPAMARAFYCLPVKDIKAAVDALAVEGVLAPTGTGYLLREDAELLADYQAKPLHFVYAVHRNDILYKTQEAGLKAWAKKLTQGLPYDCEPLQYLLVDGRFRGASVGHFRNGPYDLNDVVCDMEDAGERREEIIAAVAQANYGHRPLRFMGREI